MEAWKRTVGIAFAFGVAVAAGFPARGKDEGPGAKPMEVGPVISREDRDQIDRWVSQMTDADSKKRDAAQEKLDRWTSERPLLCREIGRLLRETMDRHADPEIHARLEGSILKLSENLARFKAKEDAARKEEADKKAQQKWEQETRDLMARLEDADPKKREAAAQEVERMVAEAKRNRSYQDRGLRLMDLAREEKDEKIRRGLEGVVEKLSKAEEDVVKEKAEGFRELQDQLQKRLAGGPGAVDVEAVQKAAEKMYGANSPRAAKVSRPFGGGIPGNGPGEGGALLDRVTRRGEKAPEK